jgi:hypothetical protein
LLAPQRKHNRFIILLCRSTESTRSENVAKFQKTRKLLTLIYMNNARAYTARATKRDWIFPNSNARHSHRIARILIVHHPTFSFRLAENPAWTERI